MSSFPHPNGCICYTCHCVHLLNQEASEPNFVLLDCPDNITTNQRSFLEFLRPALEADGDLSDIASIVLDDFSNSPKLINIWRGTAKDLQARCKMIDTEKEIKTNTFLAIRGKQLMLISRHSLTAENLELFYQMLDVYEFDVPDREKIKH